MGRIEVVENETTPTDAESVFQHIEWDLNDSSIMESSESWRSKSQIVKFYSGKHIFITGATGFMGLALVEKLLRACPDIAAMYLLIRPKRGKSAQERIDALFEHVLFQKVQRERGKHFYKKVIPIIGDIGDIDLGISKSDADMLASKVELIFHVAANVKFNEPMTTMVKVNTRATKYIVELAKRCKNLKALLHVSTAYSNCRQPEVIEEQFYESAVDPHKIIEIVEKANMNEVTLLTRKLIDDYPNTYTFCKQIAEHLIKESGLPSCVFRPAIVSTSNDEPISGWTENLAGPSGLLVGVGLGIIRLVINDIDNNLEIIPVDISINAMIACAWDVAQKQSLESPKPIVYNNVSSASNPMSWKYFTETGIKLARELPSMKAIWYIEVYFLKDPFWYWIIFLLLHVIPGTIIDSLFYFKGKDKGKDDPGLMELYRKLYNNNYLVNYFTLHKWRFEEDNLRAVFKQMSTADMHTFPADVKLIDWAEFIRRMILGLRLYVIKDDINTLPVAKKRLRKFKYAHYLIKETILLCILYWLCTKLIGFILEPWLE